MHFLKRGWLCQHFLCAHFCTISISGVLGVESAHNLSDDTTAYFSASYTIMSLRRGAQEDAEEGRLLSILFA